MRGCYVGLLRPHSPGVDVFQLKIPDFYDNEDRCIRQDH